MGKKLGLVAIMLSVITTVGFIGFGIWHSRTTTPTFSKAGYILQGNESGVKQLSFASGESYAATLNGAVRFKSTNGEEAIVSRESFVHMEDDSVMALADGVLLDFQDLSENFINNYYITAKLPIARSGDTYLTETTAGTMEFGDHLWKLSESKYIIRAATLKVHFSDEDTREVNDYVQITISPDKVVYLLTPENLWMTISENCYIETPGGVRINPVSLIVDDGAVKLSLAKLTVSTDDAIVLTEDETRRQIVPELNIEAIDGEDGTVGVAGEDGQAGENGEQGTEGEDGRDGEVGTDGETGKDGEVGTDGEAGTSGADGASGADGGQGAAGQNGQAGSSGAKGADGKKGSTPTNEGLDGADGEAGSTGQTGADAEVESSTKTAIPVMTLSKFMPTATSVSGTIKIVDEGNMLSAIKDVGEASYPGTVTITEVATGRTIHCYPKEDSINYTFTEFYSAFEVDFCTHTTDQLMPNMEYRLVVKAYYKASDATGLIYSREFINRTFYTDSTGVVMEAESAATDSINVKVTIGEEYQGLLGSSGSVTVYLLTPEQNKTFAPTTATENYLRSSSLSSVSFDNYQATVKFDNNVAEDETQLTPNTRYIVRAYIDTGSFKTLTTQELSVMTLKRPPKSGDTDIGEIDTDTIKPTAVYNRATGRVEVFRPKITDQDGGAVKYIYTPQYYKDGGWVNGQPKTITAATGDPVEFFQEAGVPYQYQITMIFDDNEKEVTYDLGTSTAVTTTGDPLPGLTLENVTTGQMGTTEYDTYKGTLRITLGEHSHLKIDANNPLTLTLYADQVVTSEMKLTTVGSAVTVLPGNADKLGTVKLLDGTGNTNYVDIELDLQNLYRNTTYSIRVDGYINLGAGEEEDPANGPHSLQSLGSVNFRTKDLVTTKASFTQGEAGANAFARNLKIEFGTGQDEDRINHAREQLENGQLVVILYNGNTAREENEIGRMYINDQTALRQVYGDEGYTITDRSFGQSLSSGGSYTLQLKTIADDTWNKDLGYVNDDFAVGDFAIDIITARPSPPELLSVPTNGVTVIAIENSKAENYGGKKDNNLPDDTIVGYALQATYKNDQRIGKTVTYYAFEFANYANMLNSGTDPIQSGSALMTMTREIPSNSNTVPKVALFFGGTKTVSDGDAQTANGWVVYYAGEANNTSGSALESGMGRGYRYIFAYTAKYQATDNDPVRDYPDADSQDYKDQMTAGHGGLTLNGTTVGRNVGYFLTSGLCAAPRNLPDFHTYVYNSESHLNSGQAEGRVILHYTYRDPEGMIDTANPPAFYLQTWNTETNAMGNDTQLGSVGQGDIVSEQGEKNEWRKLEVPYSGIFQSTIHYPLEVSVGLNGYGLDYTGSLGLFNYNPDPARLALSTIPIEWPWEDAFNENGYSVNVIAQNVPTSNYYVFRMNATNSSEPATDVLNHAVALELTFTQDGKTKTWTEPLLYSSTNGVHARILYSTFQTEFGTKAFNLESARLLYDTGRQGWGPADTNAWGADVQLAYQYTNASTTDGTVGDFGFAGYLGGKDISQVPASGALLTSRGFNLKNLRQTVESTRTANEQTYYTTYRTITAAYANGIRVYPDEKGMSAGNTEFASETRTRYVVPKVVGVFPKAVQITDGNGLSVSEMTPTVKRFYTDATNSSLTLSSLKIESMTGGGTIYAAVYLDKSAAGAVGSGAVQTLKINIKEDGTVESWSLNSGGAAEFNDDRPTFSGLETHREYWLVFYDMKDSAARVFLDGMDTSEETVKQAVYSRFTSENPVLTITDKTPTNTSYELKSLTFGYRMTSYSSASDLRFSIYDTQAHANDGGNEGLLYTHDELMDTENNNANQLLQYSKSITGGTNYFTLNLKPRPERSKLVPGQSYWLRIEVIGNDDAVIEESTCVEQFEVISKGLYAGMIYTAVAQKDEISFQVTISDPQFTLMNGRYAVRFTYEENGKEKRLKTIYDDKVYDTTGMGALRREFVLTTDALTPNNAAEHPTTITEQTTYHMYVYAVKDDAHKGEVEFTLNGAQKWNSADFFDGVASSETEVANTSVNFFSEIKGFLGDLTKGLLSILESFWDSETFLHKGNVSATENKFLLTSKTQSTTNESGWTLNTDPNKIYAYRMTDGSGHIRVVFEESFGLVNEEDSNDDVFKWIDWTVTIETGTGFTTQSGPEAGEMASPKFQKGTQNGKGVFYVEIPCNAVQSGRCTVTLHLYEDGSHTGSFTNVTTVFQ